MKFHISIITKILYSTGIDIQILPGLANGLTPLRRGGDSISKNWGSK